MPTAKLSMSDPASPSHTPGAQRLEGAQGYMVSSFELSAGLEVTAVAVNSLPAEVLREFQRLRLCWEQPPARPLPPLALRS
jgi:hypothetical protein